MVEITSTFKRSIFMRPLLPRLAVRILNECREPGTAGCHKNALRYRRLMTGREALVE
jgi:hypothetical protein